jgi:glycosyltransferase involved in cell wall biosynthesis
MNTISIITICFNNLEELKQTCLSVDSQTYLPYEHIIIDGSTGPDIKSWLMTNGNPPYRKWISEKDQGISDAFNKGIRLAGGEIISTLNSGDSLYDNSVLKKVQDAFIKNPTARWCHGKLYLYRGDQWVTVGKPFDPEKLYRGMRSVFHPTMYVKKELYNRYGLYDLNIKIAMDYDFLCRIARENFIFLEEPLAKFDPRGLSSNQYLEAMHESFASYKKYFGHSAKQRFWGWRLTFLHHLIHTPAGKWLYRLKVKMGFANT